jgi:dTDP-4-amino-4,6-dideoxygalactose transaminase
MIKKIKQVQDMPIDAQTLLRQYASWPFFDQDEIDAVSRVLRSGKVNYWTGEEVLIFEREFAAFHGVNYAVALANGTVALELALRVLRIGPGDEVIVTPRTFIASASCIVLQGAIPVFADVDRESQNISAESIQKVLSSRTKAIITVHLAGWPCDMDPILDLAQKRGLFVIEDCAQAHGASYKGRYVGSFGDIAAFSFCQDKIMTTGGEGGMITTNNREIWSKVWSYKDHGKSYEAVQGTNDVPGYKWLHDSFGTNLRMTEMQAAIGRIQLRKLPNWLTVRRRNADILTKHIRNIPALRITIPPEHIQHAYYKYYTFVRPDLLNSGWDRDRIIRAISAEGVPCFSGSCSEIYLEKSFEANGIQVDKRLSLAKELGETSLMFLVHPTLSQNDLENAGGVIGKVMAVASKAK